LFFFQTSVCGLELYIKFFLMSRVFDIILKKNGEF
jgi:hypothetical protein